MHAAPLASLPGVDGCFGAGNRRNAIWPMIQEDGLRVGHLSARGQPENGAQLRREARPITLKVGLEDADATNLGCQTKSSSRSSGPHIWSEYPPAASHRKTGVKAPALT